MKNYLLLIIAFFSAQVFSQETYLSLIDKAQQSVEDDKKIIALDYYSKAFFLYKDSINSFDLYDVAEVSSNVNQLDQSFFYLNILVKRQSKPYPGWYFILDKDSKTKLKNLLTDKRWKNLEEASNKLSKRFYDSILVSNNEFFRTKKSSNVGINDKKELYQKLRNRSSYLPKKEKNYSVFFPINDSIKSSYFVTYLKIIIQRKNILCLFFFMELYFLVNLKNFLLMKI